MTTGTKRTATRRTGRAFLLASTCLIPGTLLADGTLPADPTIVAGDITITSPDAASLLVAQGGAYGIIDWGSFSIGAGNGVSFQNGAGATLNRVTGNELSQIYGRLDATGSVYLINQNGIVFGAEGVVNTGGTFVASTLDLRNEDFLDGGEALFQGDSDAYVLNLGQISSLGGDVAILARDVVNEGTISAPEGTVGLVAGREILMRDAAVADGLFAVQIGGDDTSVTEAGAIRAAAAELRANGGNVYALAGNTEGTIAATGVEKVGGRVFLTAGDGGKVQVEKDVSARDADGSGGRIVVDGAEVEVAGTLDASGNRGGEVRITGAVATDFSGRVLAFGDGSAGSGGFAEVSGAELSFGGDVQTGGGTVLLDPNNIEITSSINILSGATVLTAATIQGLLATQNVIVQTSGGDGEAGTILVTDSISWSSDFGLSLLAHGDLILRGNIRGTSGANGLNLVAGWDGSTSTTAFDPTPFLSADLASTSLFGNANGISYIANLAGGAVNASGSIFVENARAGVANGATRAFANNITLTGTTGASQLGFNVTSIRGVDMTGDIVVRATGDLALNAGSARDTAAQIGHVGIDFGTDSIPGTFNASGDIVVEAAGGIDLVGGAGFNAYAMIGHGSRALFSTLEAQGDMSGSIEVTAAGEMTLVQGGFSEEAWIGHATGSGTLSGTIIVEAANFDTDTASTVGAGGTGTLDVDVISQTTAQGSVTYRATDATAGSGLNLTGSTGPIVCECSFVNTGGDMVFESAGDILLDSTFFYSNTGGGNLALAAARNFHNNSGADAFGTFQGNWRVYSTRPDQDTGDIGTLLNHFVRTGVTYDAADPFADLGSVVAGNGLVYVETPLITIGDATFTYGDTITVPGATVTVDGLAVDAAEWGFSIDSIFLNSASVTLSSTGFVNAGTWANAFDFTFSPVSTITGGYDSLSFILGTLTVDQRALTASIAGTPTKTYDGTTAATLTAADFSLSGFADGEGGSVTQTAGTYASADAAAAVAVTANLGAGDIAGDSATDLANYILPTSAAGTGAIDRATLTATITGTPTKTYDGTTAATLTDANFSLDGFVAGQGATITQTSGVYGTANAGTDILVSASLAAGDFTAGAGTLLSNYVLPVSATGTGTIDRATLTATIIGTPTKTYDGTTDANLSASDFALTGFVAGEGGTITQDAGLYASANAAASVAVTASLAEGNFTADEGTLLSNYVLPVSASGTGAIDRASLTASITGVPTKAYDGTTDATLTAADFTLSGFVGDEGASITQTAGLYASANAGTGILVTANLAAGDFAASGGTLLSNYILPVSATGEGNIDRATLSATIIGNPTKTYDGTAAATLTAANFQLDGFAAGEGASVSQTTGLYSSANAGNGLTVTASLAAGDFAAIGGTLLSNYVLPVSATGTGTIDRALLAASIIGTPTKAYDGTTAATLTAADFALTGFIAGEGATVVQTAGTYDSANAGAAVGVNAGLAAGDFVADRGTLLANYVLPVSAAGTGAIDRLTLTAAIIGTPTKVYDGTTTATLTAANFQLTGFIAGEGADVTQTAGTYASANASATNLVTASLTSSDFSGTGSTLMANYVLPTLATGNGAIDRALLSATITGTPTKPFDGTTTATLTSANFLLSGFVAGEGATVTQTQGSYATADAGVPNTVTADLAAGDFAADSGTSLANYVLPTRAIGPGSIGLNPPVQPEIPQVITPQTFETTPLGEPSSPATSLETINDETTQRILDEIRQGAAFCKALVRQEYVIDCLADRLQSVADGISAVGEYSEVRAALEDAAQELHALVLANASQELAQQVMRAGGQRSSRPLTAVSTEALGAVNAQAAAIIEGAELVLLRSSSGSEARSEAFTQVAQVVNSTKVLLRSS